MLHSTILTLALAILPGLAAAADGFFQLILATQESQRTGAACLDGSAPGFYIEHGKGDGVNKWIVFFQGGGWCYNEQDCLNRSKSALGSSKFWPQQASFGGVLSSDGRTNPDFANWNHVHFMYCDGASFSGARAEPLVVSGTNVFMRGHLVLNSLFATLKEKFEFDRASDILLTGCSAGGLSTYLHADYVHETFAPQNSTFKAMPECGYFLDYPNAAGMPVFTPQMQHVYEMQQLGNTLASVNSGCLRAHKALGDEWKCLFAPYTLPHVRSPYFILNSLYDSWQMSNIVGAGVPAFVECANHFPQSCTPGNINDANKFHDVMLMQLNETDVLRDDARNGAFLHSCWNHCEAQNSPFWTSVRVGSKSLGQAVGDWYFERSVHNVHVDCKMSTVVPYTCNPTC